MTPKERYFELRELIVQITGLEECCFSTRRRPYPSMNAIIWKQMRDEGFTVTQIARASDKDHSTIVTATGKIKDIIKQRNPSWRDILRIWDEFQDVVEDEKDHPHDLSQEHKLQLEKESIINKILKLPKDYIMDIVLTVQESMSITEIDTTWETSTTTDQ